ncbi:DUF3488 and transglutaminase-like domain-containing protein [Chitiniphilus purpureus]|uniref:DUF3488 and transglutaminase-like domain-containing protein n=1 Tax=Chitiniphilus purpureus TaxID=2981137 RepID=A0ABY6DJ18_9NEIS|nr:DUF3488 and transglutaminase-like domain-containing protein [Chitiniphilus sp. CD1]UXY14355.1 DUF3488 and transglutaminase-like domain-containing protein [Chitiniphilus sp. CD1]
MASSAAGALPRDKMLALIGVLALILAPHLIQLPPWLAIATALPLLWRGHLAISGRRLPGRAVRLLLVLALAILVFWEFRTLVGRSGGVALLISLVALKLLETTGKRDILILTLLAYFVIGTLFLVSQSFWMLAYATCIAIALTGQLFAWQRDGTHLLLEEYRRALRLLLEGLPVALLLFVLFPRLSGPLWSMPQDEPGASTGISDSMTPGDFSELVLDDRVAFRIDFRGPPPPRDALYWRGPVFERFDGLTWHQRDIAQAPGNARVLAQGPTVAYTITLEPHQRAWLFALDLPTKLPPDTRLTSRLQAVYRQPLLERARFDLESTPRWRIEEEAGFIRNAALALPPEGNQRTRALAAGWRPLPAQERVQRALAWLRGNGFVYTLAPQLLEGPDRIDQLLFSTREGFCEHYAGAFAFLMRAAGVPARVVAGYMGGEYNAAGGYWIVRQADAHAWVEVWLDGQGWQRVDPTAVVAPLRLSSGLARSVRGSERLPMLMRDQAAWLARMRLQWDSVVYVWDQWVIGYDARRQMQLLGRLGIDDLVSTAYLAWFGGGLGAILLGFALLLQWQGRRRGPTDRAARLWARFLRRLAGFGLVPGPAEGPRDFAARAAQALPQHAPRINAIAAAYLAARYADSPEALSNLAQDVGHFYSISRH